MTARIVVAVQNDQLEAVRDLFQEYAGSLGIDLGFQGFPQELADLPGKYAPPRGCILLATVDGEPAGCVAMRPLGDAVCEMKRLYVRRTYRKLGLGRKLAERAIEEARQLGYRRMRLDTIGTIMGEAVALYRTLGFVEVPPYCRNPIPDALYFELRLT
jgi:GNAT superfamily N-acetyltransferase